MLHSAMQLANFLGDGQRPPALLGEADAVFASDRAAPGKDLLEQFIQGSLATPFGAGLIEIDHDVRLNIAVAGVAETGDRKAVLSLEPRGESEQVFQAAAWDDDVLVQLGEAGVTWGVGEFAPNLPDGFA